MSYLIECPNKYEKIYNPKYRKFSFELDHFQKFACEGVDLNENVFVAVATGSGKTVPAEYAISKALFENKKVVYISPIKALSNQKYKDFSKDLESNKIGIMTGDNKVNPQADLVVMTAEIFRNSLYRAINKNTQELQEESLYFFDPTLVKYVILDEIHYINDKDRGKVWEEILMLLPNDIQLTMLSATIDSPEVLAEWIGNKKQKNTRLIKQYHRPVPLKFYLQNENKKMLIMDTQWQDNVYRDFKVKSYQPVFWLNHSIKMLEQEKKLPSIYFVLSKAKIDFYVTKIVGNFLTYEETKQVKKIWRDKLFKFEENYKFSNQYSQLYELVCRGIAFHHSGILPILKEIVEILYAEKLIKVLLATETFAVGVNMPTKTVVFTGLSKYCTTGRRLLRTDEFLQMAGRAGRRGIDTFGEVIVLPLYLPSEDDFKNIILGKPLALTSRLKLDYTWVLKNLYNLCQNQNSNINYINELVIIAKESFLEKNSDSYLKQINNEIIQNEKKLNKIKMCVNKDLDKEYLKLKLELEKQNSQNKQKKINAKILNLNKNAEFKNVLLKEKLEKEIKNKNLQLGFQKNKLEVHFTKIIDYLETQGLINNFILTSFGLIVKEVNEINPLIFGYLTFENYLDNLTFPQLCAFLSIFLDVKNTDTSINDLNLIPEEIELILKAEETMNYYYENELILINELPYPILQNYDIGLENYEIVRLWAEGHSWNKIKNNYNNFEGNFCKMILRIHNLLKEIKPIFSILKKPNLVKIIDEKSDTLLRELVQTDSLYLF